MRMLERSAMLLVALALLPGCYDGRAGMAGDLDPDEGEATGEGGEQDDDDAIPEDLEADSVPEPLAVRLTHTQYAYTILDVLGTELTEQELVSLPRDVPIEGSYSSTALGQSFGSQYVLAYAQIARSLTERLDPDALLAEHGGCDSVDPACLEAFVDGLGLRAFRRPLLGEERARFLDLAQTIGSLAETTDAHVVRGIVQAMLQAPAFLYRMEGEREGAPGEVRRVTGWELASRLSYFLWQSAPDDALLAFAAGPEGDGDYEANALPEQIERMIADPRFARSRAAFWGDYSLASMSAFGGVDPALAEQLRDSLLASFERLSGVGAQPEPLSALFDGDVMVMTPEVAEVAGVSPAGEGLQVYEGVPERQGLLTHPGFLAAMGTDSFVGRGVFLTERVLCQHIGAPPDDDESAAAIEQTANETEGLTPREASAIRFELGPQCLACHAQFEPIAYAFERYDMSGRYVLADDQGRELYSDGELPPFGERPLIEFGSAPELLGELADLPQTSRCLVENMMEYAAGARPMYAGQFLDQAQASYEAEGRTFDALVSAVASSDRLTYLRTVAE